MRVANLAIDFGRGGRFDGGIKRVLHMSRSVSGIVDQLVAGKVRARHRPGYEHLVLRQADVRSQLA